MMLSYIKFQEAELNLWKFLKDKLVKPISQILLRPKRGLI